MNKTAENPLGEKVFFNELKHQYKTEDGIILTSVTKFASSYFPEFDKENVSRGFAIKNGLRQEDVLAMWDRNGKEASGMGTYIHAYCESKFNNDDFKKKNFQTQKEIAIMNVADQACEELLSKYDFIEAEKIVFSRSLRLAGTIDLLMYDKVTNRISILDWKTNKEIKTEAYRKKKAFDPIRHLEDCNANKYVLQLSIYKHILKTEKYFPDVDEFDIALIHLRPDDYQIIIGTDMNKEVVDMLNWV